MNEQLNTGCKRGLNVKIRVRMCTIDSVFKQSLIETRGGWGYSHDHYTDLDELIFES